MNAMSPDHLSRRNFLKNSSLSGVSLLVTPALGASKPAVSDPPASADEPLLAVRNVISAEKAISLAPARWIWYPSGRTLQNTFILFRKPFSLSSPPKRAQGRIMADSRYLLLVNGQRVQWGPAPSDPRWTEVDPMDLLPFLQPGDNVIGAQVLFYGQGDGTWPMGKPGFIFDLSVELEDGRTERIVSDGSWQAHLARSWRPGQYKRWYLRSLQEEFDARRYPYGWSEKTFRPDDNWLPAMEIGGAADKPSVCTDYREYLMDINADPAICQLRDRSIPLLQETTVAALQLSESLWIHWKRPPVEYFETLTPNAYEAEREPAAQEAESGSWLVEMDGKRGAALTFEWPEQYVGWPYFTVEAPAGTTIDVMVQESHEPGGPALLNTHFHAWSRFICREGVNQFEHFDYESFRWLQLHIQPTRGTVKVSNVGVRRRVFPWPQQPDIRLSDPKIQQVINASINTLHNSAQDIIVDGMGRERQQYSGDCGHQLHGIFFAFGETRLPARYLNSYSQGITNDNFFLDSWPAYDRLARLQERQMQLTSWGPLLDHGVGFNFDVWHYFLYTGDRNALTEVYPRLLRFLHYLHGIRDTQGLLPVENIGTPSVWMDHEAYTRTRHKQCAFNLYAAAMAEHALAPLCRAFSDSQAEETARTFGKNLLKATVKRFWSNDHSMFVNNLPWLEEEKQIRTCDRSLATALLFDQCPSRMFVPALKALAECPPHMGLSYPANAGWRMWALAKGGRMDVVLNDLRSRWAGMASVTENNTLQEFWQATPDSDAQWSHCPVAPLYVLYMDIAGIRPLEPGFSRYQIRPQPGDLTQLSLTAHTVKGPILYQSEGPQGRRKLTLELPEGGEGELIVDVRERLKLKELARPNIPNSRRYRLPAGEKIQLNLRFT
jgi:alpha-L-rhamnosidase